MSENSKPIGIYGGTFNPVHMGHMAAAYAFFDQCGLSRLYVLPTATSPHKAMQTDDDPAARLAMLRIAFAHMGDREGGIAVSDYEQKKGGKSYTYDTLAHFREESENLYLLCGTDMFLTLARWYRGPDILRTTTIVCFRRGEETHDAHAEASAIREMAQTYREAYGTRVLLPAFTPIPVSSTEVRDRISRGLPTEGLLPPGVGDYIRARGLYCTGNA